MKTKKERKQAAKPRGWLDEEIQCLRAQVAFMPISRISRSMGKSERTINRMLDFLGIELSSQGSAELPRGLEHLELMPVGTRCEEWIGGTTYTIPCSTPGIPSIRIHNTWDEG